MSRDAWRDGKIASRISGGDSGKKPGLARGDEPPGGCARKFFYCQKSRLRVRGDSFLPALMSRNDIAFSRTTRIVAARCRGVVEVRAARVGASERQHFLKRDAVFFDVLVYSGCSASRFPSARSN